MISEGFTLAVIFGLTAAIPAFLLGVLMVRLLRNSYESHRDALRREAYRAFDNARLANWQALARAGLHEREEKGDA